MAHSNLSKPIPYLLLGKIPGHIQATREVSKPEYEVILHRSSTSDACSVLPTLLTGGEIDGTTLPAIRLVVMGGGFSHDEFQSVYETVPHVKNVPWLRPAVRKPGNASTGPPPSGPPSAEVVAKRLRAALDEHLEEMREREKKAEGDREKGVIWWF